MYKKKHSPYYIKKEKKKRKWISFKKKSLFLFKFFSPQKKLITLFSSPDFPLYSQQKKIYTLFFLFIYFHFYFYRIKNITYVIKNTTHKKIHYSEVEIVKCSIVQLKILMFKSCKILCFLVVDFVAFFIPPQKL